MGLGEGKPPQVHVGTAWPRGLEVLIQDVRTSLMSGRELGLTLEFRSCWNQGV